MLKLKPQYFGHLMRRIDSLEKTLMLGGIGGTISPALPPSVIEGGSKAGHNDFIKPLISLVKQWAWRDEEHRL